jgi:hypothetical protein
MGCDYYDVPMTLQIVIAVSAENEEEAIEKLYLMEDTEVIQLLQEQSGFISDDFTSTTAH